MSSRGSEHRGPSGDGGKSAPTTRPATGVHWGPSHGVQATGVHRGPSDDHLLVVCCARSLIFFYPVDGSSSIQPAHASIVTKAELVAAFAFRVEGLLGLIVEGMRKVLNSSVQCLLEEAQLYCFLAVRSFHFCRRAWRADAIILDLEPVFLHAIPCALVLLHLGPSASR